MRQDFLEPREEQYTTWHNPLSVEQYVDLHDGDAPTPTRYRFKPGESRPLPSRFDGAIQRTHNGVIIGGLAPQLVKVEPNEQADESAAAPRRRGAS